MPPGYSGAWRNRQAWIDQPALATGADPAHMDPDYDPAGARVPPNERPRLDYPPPGVDDEYAEQLHDAAQGGPIDRTPLDHAYGTTAELGESEDEARLSANLARSEDLGAVDRLAYDAPRARGHDERYETHRWPGESTTTGSRVAVFRGANSLPENNPDGYPLGHRITRWVHRRIVTHWLRHDERPVPTHTAAAPLDSPALENGNQYTSPFGWLANSRRRKAQGPMLRRVPRAWDEDAITDGTEPPLVAAGESEYQSWGL